MSDYNKTKADSQKYRTNQCYHLGEGWGSYNIVIEGQEAQIIMYNINYKDATMYRTGNIANIL